MLDFRSKGKYLMSSLIYTGVFSITLIISHFVLFLYQKDGHKWHFQLPKPLLVCPISKYMK